MPGSPARQKTPGMPPGYADSETPTVRKLQGTKPEASNDGGGRHHLHGSARAPPVQSLSQNGYDVNVEAILAFS